jgi:Uma2 family endonuclease
MTIRLLRRQFTTTDYARMRESGILTEDDRVELLDGEVYLMSPIGPLHVTIVNRLNRILVRQVGDDAIVSIQNPIQLDTFSEPQPDVTVLRYRADEYATKLPVPADILLLIEVADTSLAYDRQQKLPRYAIAQIQEVWIVDVEQQIIEQYTSPMADQYTQLHKVLYSHSISSTMMPQIQLETDSIF